MKNFFKRFFPAYFGPPKAADIETAALANAQAHMAQLLTDRDLLEGQIQGFRQIIARLTQP